MAKEGTLSVRVVGDTQHFDKKMGGLGKTAAVAFAAVGAAAAAGAVKSVMAFTEFEGQMNEVFTLLPGISQDAMDDMSGQVKDFSKEFGVLPDEVVPALYQSLSAGVPKDNVFEFLETAQMAAKGGVTELTTAVDGISSVVNAYGSDVMDATQASDLMFTAVRLGKTNFEELSASLSNVTPIASGLGVKFEDVSAGLAAMTAKGTPTAQATTQLRSLFVDLSKAGGKTATVFEEMAGKSFQDFIAEGGNTADALDIMKKAADESGVQLQDLFGSVEAGSAALSLASGDTFVKNIEEMGGAAGATEDAFDQMMTGLGPIFDKIKAGIAVFLIDVGQKLAPFVEQAMERAGEAFAIISDWWDENGPAVIAAVFAVRDAIAGWIREVGPPIESWVRNVLGSISQWWSDNGPLIIGIALGLKDALVGVFRGIQTALGFVIRNWDRFKLVVGIAAAVMINHFATLAVAATISAAKQVAAWVTANAAAIGASVVHTAQIGIMVAKWAFMGVQALLHAAKIAAAWLISMGPIGLVIAAVVGLVAVIVKNWDTIKRVVSFAAQAVWGFVVDRFNAIVSFAMGFRDRFVGFVQNAIDWIVDKFMRFHPLGIVAGKFDEIVSFIAGLPGRIADAARGLFDGMVNAAKSGLNAIIRFFNNSLGKIGFDIPSWVPKIGGNSFRLPKIPELAEGGIVTRPTVAVVGEAGPEAVIPLTGSGARGFGGMTVQMDITIQAGWGADGREIGEKIIDALKEWERRSGALPLRIASP